MDNWQGTCQSCATAYKVAAYDEQDAVTKVRAEHERAQERSTQHRCDLGPMVDHAFNLTHPDHPGAPKDY